MMMKVGRYSPRPQVMPEPHREAQPVSDPLRNFSTRTTPQTEQADPRQVPNTGGGYGFEVSLDTRIMRFLTLGTNGGTYYASEQKLTQGNARDILGAAKNHGEHLVDLIKEVSWSGRAPRNKPALFALAIASAHGNEKTRQAAFAALPMVARTGEHLFQWVTYREQFGGWGRGMRRAIANWYLQADDVERIAYQMCKYRQRHGWSHRNLARLSHLPAHMGPEGALFDFLAGREPQASRKQPGRGPFELPPLIHAFKTAQDIGRAAEQANGMTVEPGRGLKPVREWVALIQQNPALSWEMLPDLALKHHEVWEALIANGMPQTALIRNLSRLTNLGLLDPMGQATKVVCDQLADPEKLRKGRVHPITVLLALTTYAAGRSVDGKATWVPSRPVVDALDAAFYAAYGAVEPAGVRTSLSVDISGSMTMSTIAGTHLRPREASMAIALVTAATEPQYTLWGFSDNLIELSISPRQRLDDVVKAASRLPFGWTDCALPMTFAMQHNLVYDHFCVITDHETNTRSMHPYQALRQYRERVNPKARLSVVGMTPTRFSIADPDDRGSLDVAGFDGNCPQMLANFGRGDL
jgi:60 kDa SS-A/Ro ribonucleoprotein